MKRRAIIVVVLAVAVAAALLIGYRTYFRNPRQELRDQTAALMQSFRKLRLERTGDMNSFDPEKVQALVDRVERISASMKNLASHTVEEILTEYDSLDYAGRFREGAPFLMVRSGSSLSPGAGWLDKPLQDELAKLIEETRKTALIKREFEAGLSEAELAKVIGIESNESIDPIAGRLSRFPPHVKLKPCDFDDVREVAKEMGWRRLMNLSVQVMALAELRDLPWLDQFFPRLAEIAEERQDPRFRRLARIYRDELLKRRLVSARVIQQILMLERYLVDMGLSREDLPGFVGDLAERSPECFVGLDMGLIEKIKGRVAIDDMSRIIEVLTARRGRSQTLPEGEDLGEILKEEDIARIDPWGRLYSTSISQGRLLVASSGPDMQLGTDDDITGSLSMDIDR